MRFNKVVWSPVEEEWLKKNTGLSVSQLTVALAKSTTAVKRKLDELLDKPSKKQSSIPRTVTSKKGRRKDCDNLYLRSTWEAGVFRWLRYTNAGQIEYEPHTFSFAPFGILKGTVSYMPDFKLTFTNGTYIWIEVKGFLKAQDKVRIRRLKKFYPDEFTHLRAVCGGPSTKSAQFFKEMGIPILAYYPDLHKQFRGVIPHWGE